MITVNCPMKQEDVIAALSGSHDGIEFRFLDKKGIKLHFQVDTEDLDQAVATAKNVIKATPFGNVLYFQVTK